jgi:hypothetical protein
MVKSATQPQVVRAKMKSNPVCDIHPRAVMKLEQVQSPDPEHKIKGYIYRCSTLSCNRAFHSDAGYFDVVSGKLLIDGAVNKVICPEHENSMHLVKVKVTRGEGRTETWRCSEGCRKDIERTGD